MKNKYLKFGIFLSAFLIFNVIQTGSAQEKVERKIEIKTDETDNGLSIHLKVEKEDGSIYEKTYNSKEEMYNDPELKDLNIHLGTGDEEGFLMKTKENQDGKYEVIVKGEDGEPSQKVLMFKAEDGTLHELQEGDHIRSDEGDQNEMNNVFFKNENGTTYKITKDESGEMTIEKNGEPVNIEDLKKEDLTDITLDEEGHVKIFKDEDGNYTIKLADDLDLDGKDGQVFVIHEGDLTADDIEELENGNFTIDVNVDTDVDEDGNHVVTVHKKIEKIHVKILDISDPEELTEIPGAHLNSGAELDLEGINYYPNPSNGQFTLRFAGDQTPTQVRIIDLMGKEVYNENIPDFSGSYDKEINLSGNNPGTYVLQVIQNDKSWSKKVVLE